MGTVPCWIEGANNKLIGNVAKESLYGLVVEKNQNGWFIVNNGCKGCLMSCMMKR